MAVQYQNQSEIIKMYLDGTPISHIAKKFKTSSPTINKVIANPDLRMEVEKKFFALDKSRENRKISETKDKIVNFINSAIEEAETKEGKIAFLSEIKSIIGELDRISRLNSGEVTERTENTNKNIEYDVAKLMDNLKTEEDKKRFLQSQL